MSDMRKAAAELRSDATAGLSSDDVEQLVDLLIAIKANVTRHLAASDDDDEPLSKSATGA